MVEDGIKGGGEGVTGVGSGEGGSGSSGGRVVAIGVVLVVGVPISGGVG